MQVEVYTYDAPNVEAIDIREALERAGFHVETVVVIDAVTKTRTEPEG